MRSFTLLLLFASFPIRAQEAPSSQPISEESKANLKIEVGRERQRFGVAVKTASEITFCEQRVTYLTPCLLSVDPGPVKIKSTWMGLPVSYRVKVPEQGSVTVKHRRYLSATLSLSLPVGLGMTGLITTGEPLAMAGGIATGALVSWLWIRSDNKRRGPHWQASPASPVK